jgi:hypothetical protein
VRRGSGLGLIDPESRVARVDLGEVPIRFSTGVRVEIGEESVDFGEDAFMENQSVRYDYPVDFGEHANRRINYLPNSPLTKIHGDKFSDIRQGSECHEGKGSIVRWAPFTN